MKKEDPELKDTSIAVKRLTWLAAFASALIAFLIPAGFFLAVYYHEQGALEAEAQTDSFFISRIASENPVLWQYQQHRLQDVLDRRPRGGYAETRRVLDLDGRVIADSSNAVGFPTMSRSYPVLDAGRTVAVIEIIRSLRPVLLNTVFVFLLSLMLGGVILYLIRVLPIRSVRSAEEQVALTMDELLHTNEDMKSFVYSAAHDLRAPLVNLKGFARELSLLLGEVRASLEASRGGLSDAERDRLSLALGSEARESLHYIDTATQRMDRLVNALIKLSQSGQRLLKIEAVETGDVVRSLLKSFDHEITARSTMVTVGPLPAVDADRLALEQIFGNVIENAIKYLMPGRPGRIEISGELTADNAVFRVQDNGRGIEPDDMEKLFKMFRRLGEQDVPGEGIGLANIKTLIRRHGGRIWCDSAPREGTTFTFTFPRKQRQRKILTTLVSKEEQHG